MSSLFQGAGLPAAPVHMASGFHQLAPIIIQAGLMRANEVLCVENPEVHLHPKLQLEIAEFLLRHARIGKYMIVETHSDLVVRRVMRAVLAEELRQEAVRIYFTRVDTGSGQYREHGVAFSVLDRVEMDERGKIRNWPEGFMDDDVRESRRLLDVMYGTPWDDEDDSEEES
jgi:predicted ATPase